MKTSKRFLPILIVLGLGGLYFIWLKLTGWAIPCMFYKISGYRCPGCGVTGLIYHVIHLEFLEAYRANPFLFVTGPLLLAEIFYSSYRSFKGKKLSKWNEIAVVVYAVALCVFGVVRNL